MPPVNDMGIIVGARFFVYSVISAAMAGTTGTDTPSIQIGGDHDFIACSISGNATAWDFTMTISDGASGNFITSDRTHARAIFGAMQGATSGATGVSVAGPFILSVPFRFSKNTQIQMALANLSAATNQVWISFAGFKVVPGAPVTYQAPSGQAFRV